MMKGTVFFLIITLLCCGTTTLHAQDEKGKVPVFNYVIDDPMDKFGSQKDSVSIVRYFLYPRFFTYWPIDNNDTILKYLCFDASHNLVDMDTLLKITDVQHISFIKSYTDYLQTNIDTTDGKPHPLSVSTTLYQYDRTGADTWKGFDFGSNFTSQLREYKDNIVKADTTVVVNPVTGNKQLTIRQYYQVVEIDDSIEAKSDTLVPDLLDTTKKELFTFYYYTVPDFYFHLPKKVKDTTFEFFSYDSRDTLIKNVVDYDSVHYYSEFKSFIDSMQTYLDNNGQKQLLPVSSITKRYDKQGRDKWLNVEYPSNKFTVLQEFKSIIVSVDTEAVKDPAINRTTLNIYKHYKVIKE